MAPIQDLLNRIRWDKQFGTGRFEVGYLDHVERGIIRARFDRMHFEEGNRFSFQLEDATGETLTIPFHRVKEVYRDGTLIWQRSA